MASVKLQEALKKYGDLVVIEARKNLNKPVKKGVYNRTGKSIATGNLYNSLAVKPTPCGIDITMADYGQAVNEGRKPGKGVPPKTLEKWVRKKIKGNEDPDSLAFMINRSIKKNGIRATGFLDKAFDTVNKMDIPEINEAIMDGVFEGLKANETCKT